MDIVNFLASFWGFSLVIISLAFLINPKHIDSIGQLMEDHKNVLVFGLINVMLGVAFILLYNVWDQSWKVIITILAWLILVRGIACLFYPQIIKRGIEKIKTHREWFSYVLVALTIIGCALVYLGMNY